MIKKIIRVENVGNFVNCKAVGDVEFRQVTLVLGENARGKSTLAAILRLLSTREPQHVLGRRCLGSAGESAVEILLDSGVAKFAEKAWSQTYPQIVVFDQAFVHDNVYAGDFVDHEHKKNLLGVIVGSDGVKLAQRVEALDSQAREQTRAISEQRAAIERRLPSAWRAEAFLKLQPDPDIDGKIELQQQEVSRLERAVIGRITVLVATHVIALEFDDFASRILQQIDNLHQQNTKLRAARDLLLPRLMSGEIAV